MAAFTSIGDTVSKTPKKIHSLVDRCCFCGMSFLEIILTGSGRKNVQKLPKQKLRVNEERLRNMKTAVKSLSLSDNETAICIKCYRKVESVIRQQKNLHENTSELEQMRNRIEQDITSVDREKRLIRSPAHEHILKIPKFPNTVIVKHPLQLSSFQALACKQIAPSSQQQDKENIYDASKAVSKTARKSLAFPEKVQGHGEVEIIVNYPSGRKSAFIWPELHKSICKVLLNGKNCENVILDWLAKDHSTEIISCAASIVRNECKNVCKRSSDSILRKTEYDGLFNFTWQSLDAELQNKCPSLLKFLESAVCDIAIPRSIDSKLYTNLMITTTMVLHTRSQEMSAVHYLIGFVLANGGCTQQIPNRIISLLTIETLAKLGLIVRPETVHRKLLSWGGMLNEEILQIKNEWAKGGRRKYQLVGDNWDKDILPSYRTTDRKTESLHLFNVYAIVDRIVPETSDIFTPGQFSVLNYIPSLNEQNLLLNELVFIFATTVVEHVPQMQALFGKIYPTHLTHKYSDVCGNKTEQYSLGLFDCNENKTQDLIQLLKHLTEVYVPTDNEEIFEAVFFGGDRLTDERVQCAQMAMKNANSPRERLEGFISKIEDFHRLMNFLEAIFKLTYSTQYCGERGIMAYYRNVLNYRNAKGDVKNAYRAYKMLYYAVLDAIILYMFMDFFNETDEKSDIPLPLNFNELSAEEKIQWLNNICSKLVEKWFFENSIDICASVREILDDSSNSEYYWVSNKENERFKCHFCEKSYAFVSTLKEHEMKKHGYTESKKKKPKRDKSDSIQNYILMLFKLVMLHKNLDNAVDMGDGERCVRSAKYELPIYNKTNKIKYEIGSIQLTALAEEILPADQKERFKGTRFVNVQGGKNSNIALDEYLEMLNRDSKLSCTGYKTKKSIINHSREYPLLTKAVKHVEQISNIRKSKGFHHVPEYKNDVRKIPKDLQQLNVLHDQTIKCSIKNVDKNPYNNSATGLVTMIHRHRPACPYRRLRDQHV